MLTRTSKGVLREVFVEPNPADFAGVQDVIVQTSIFQGYVPNAYLDRPAIDYVEVYQYIDAVIGTPVIPDPIPFWDPQGFLRVRIQQTAPGAGNGAAFTLDIRLNSTLVR